MGRHPRICAACKTRPPPGHGGTEIVMTNGRSFRVCRACIFKHGRTELRRMLRLVGVKGASL